MREIGNTSAASGTFLSAPVPAQFPLVRGLIFMVALYGSTTSNPIESIWACGLLWILLRWFWWSEQPGILLFCLLIPFIEIHTTLIEANTAGITLNEMFFGTGRETFWMSSASLLAVALGVRAAWSMLQDGRIYVSATQLREAASSISQRKLFIAFAIAYTTVQFINLIIPYSSGFRQIEVYANGISEVILFVLTVKFMLDRKHLWAILLIFGYLIAVSIYSFFSTWKDPILVLLVASLTQISNFNLKHATRLLPIIAPALLMILVWQNVKGEYRQFLNGGRFSQRIVVSQGEALGKFQDLAIDAIISNNLIDQDELNATYRRVGYIEYFSNAVYKVPKEIPHEQGRLLESNLEFALIPRFLAPNKGLKNDKAKVEKYTDFYFGEYGGSSFSLGHYCEAYIDWGRYGMLLHLFLFGVVGGSLFLLVLNRSNTFNPLLSLGIIWICMKPWGTFQQDMITVTGQVFWGAVCHLFIFFPFYRWVNDWIRN